MNEERSRKYGLPWYDDAGSGSGAACGNAPEGIASCPATPESGPRHYVDASGRPTVVASTDAPNVSAQFNLSDGSSSSQGVLYLLNWGNSFLTRLAVSLYSLRQHYDGPATVLGSTGGEVDFPLLEQICNDFGTDLIKFETPGKGRVNSLPIKARLHELTPYDRTLYLDADTVVRAPIDELFDAIGKHCGLVAVQQADWRCGGKIRRRLSPYVDAGILSRPPDNFPAINTGVFGFDRTHEVFEVWHDTVIRAIEEEARDHCLDVRCRRALLRVLQRLSPARVKGCCTC